MLNFKDWQNMDTGEKAGQIKALSFDLVRDLLNPQNPDIEIWQNLESEELAELTDREDIKQLINNNIDLYIMGNYTIWAIFNLLIFDNVIEDSQPLTYWAILENLTEKLEYNYDILIDYIIKYYKLENITD